MTSSSPQHPPHHHANPHKELAKILKLCELPQYPKFQQLAQRCVDDLTDILNGKNARQVSPEEVKLIFEHWLLTSGSCSKYFPDEFISPSLAQKRGQYDRGKLGQDVGLLRSS